MKLPINLVATEQKTKSEGIDIRKMAMKLESEKSNRGVSRTSISEQMSRGEQMSTGRGERTIPVRTVSDHPARSQESLQTKCMLHIPSSAVTIGPEYIPIATIPLDASRYQLSHISLAMDLASNCDVEVLHENDVIGNVEFPTYSGRTVVRLSKFKEIPPVLTLIDIRAKSSEKSLLLSMEIEIVEKLSEEKFN